jgi:hypothetical protein
LTGSGDAATTAGPVPVVRSDAAIRAALDALQARRGYGEFTLAGWDVDLMRDALAAADATDYPNGVTAN